MNQVYENEGKKISYFPSGIIQTKNKIIIFQIRGDSMEPTFRDSDFVLCSVGEVENNGIYLININGNLLVKRLQFIRREKVLIISDNKLYKDEEVTAEFSEHFSIIGKVFYRCHEIS